MPAEPNHRRDFLRAIALAGPAAALSAGPTAGDEKPSLPVAGPSSEAEARMGLILARFGKSLDEDARASVRAEVDAIARRAELLRKFPLENGDGPFPVFIPYRAPLG
jgi:hypothetical protein